MLNTAYWCELAWVPPGQVVAGVRVDIHSGQIVATTPGGDADGCVRLSGLVLPGLANVHSHAFHRALRARTHHEHGSFWTWRAQMYAVADRLDPDTYLALARATYAEMALAGITCVGEFHYLHHGRGGTPYADPNAMGHALLQAAAEAGIRITLLDTLYLAGGFDQALTPAQSRFGDGDADRWAERVCGLSTSDGARIGAALHSVRAVPVGQMAPVVRWAADNVAPLHVHLSEQVAENDQCLATHAVTPTVLLADRGVLGEGTTAVHATHLTADDQRLLGESATGVCLCPTTERDLADGIGPARALASAGSPLSLGSDSHAVIDLFEEARAVEMDERLATRQRGHFAVRELLTMATADGHRALGWPGAGRIAVGAPADLVAVRLDSARTAGGDDPSATAVFAATAADVTDVVVGGRPVVREGQHLLVPDVGRALAEAIRAVT